MPCSITPIKSSWHVHSFELTVGVAAWRGEALKMKDSLLIWIGEAASPTLGEVSVATPKTDRGPGGTTVLVEVSGCTDMLATRLSKALEKHVFLCCSLTLDRFTAPILEKALADEIKRRPECF